MLLSICLEPSLLLFALDNPIYAEERICTFDYFLQSDLPSAELFYCDISIA